MSKTDALGKLFGSPTKVKIMRLFLFNPELTFDNEEVAKRVKVKKSSATKELNNLAKAGLIREKSFFKDTTKGRGKKKKKVKKRVKGWALDRNFYYLSALQNLLVKIPPFTPTEIEKRFKGAGNIKLLLISGVFIQEWDNAVDVLVVGDKLKEPFIDRAIKALEAEVGRELTYTIFDSSEFEYRISVFDKLVREILEYPHEKIVNKLGV